MHDHAASRLIRGWQACSIRFMLSQMPEAPTERPDLSDDMTDDLTNYRLEQTEKRAEKADARMERIEAAIYDLKLILVKLPTKGDLLTYSLASLAIGLTILALVVGGVIGGLDWVKIH